MYTHWVSVSNTLECISGPYEAFLCGSKPKNGIFVIGCVFYNIGVYVLQCILNEIYFPPNWLGLKLQISIPTLTLKIGLDPSY